MPPFEHDNLPEMIQHILKKHVFSPHMDFRNPRRWMAMLQNEYIAAWVENMHAIAVIAAKEDMLVYNIDYPGLVSLGDSAEERSG